MWDRSLLCFYHACRSSATSLLYFRHIKLKLNLILYFTKNSSSSTGSCSNYGSAVWVHGTTEVIGKKLAENHQKPHRVLRQTTIQEHVLEDLLNLLVVGESTLIQFSCEQQQASAEVIKRLSALSVIATCFDYAGNE